MKKYNKRNCTSCIRAEINDQYGRRIVMTGTHAYEYNIYIYGYMSITIENFKNGREARVRFNDLKKKK